MLEEKAELLSKITGLMKTKGRLEFISAKCLINIVAVIFQPIFIKPVLYSLF